MSTIVNFEVKAALNPLSLRLKSRVSLLFLFVPHIIRDNLPQQLLAGLKWIQRLGVMREGFH